MMNFSLHIALKLLMTRDINATRYNWVATCTGFLVPMPFDYKSIRLECLGSPENNAEIIFSQTFPRRQQLSNQVLVCMPQMQVFHWPRTNRTQNKSTSIQKQNVAHINALHITRDITTQLIHIIPLFISHILLGDS